MMRLPIPARESRISVMETGSLPFVRDPLPIDLLLADFISKILEQCKGKRYGHAAALHGGRILSV
jgi:hypothetical protein